MKVYWLISVFVMMLLAQSIFAQKTIERVFDHPELGLQFTFRKEYDERDRLKAHYFADARTEKEELFHDVQVDKLELYERPCFGSKSKGYIVLDDDFQIVDTYGNAWLNIVYNSNHVGKIKAWINAAEMLIDKYKLEWKNEPQDGRVNLKFLYPYYDDGKTFGVGLGLANNSKYSYSYSSNARIYILLENTKGRRFLYDLYDLPAAKLEPKTLKETYGQDKHGNWYVPSSMLDDNFVEWDEEKQQYVIFHSAGEPLGARYPRFLPDGIPDGKYKMYAVLYDWTSGNFQPLLSNPQEVVLPLPKNPLKTATPICPLENDADGFGLFMENFAHDSIFQRQHTVFPLEYRTWIPGEGDNPEVVYIQEKDWKPMDFDPKPGIKRGEQDDGNYTQHFVVEAASATIQFRGVDNGISTNFIFERRNECWYLLRVEDYST